MKRWVWLSMAAGVVFTVGFLFANEKEDVPMNEVDLNLPEFTGQVGWVEQASQYTPVGSLIGIHGTPGSWSAWRALMAEPSIQERYRFYAFDRPGWGVSQNDEKDVFPELADQVVILGEAISLLDAPTPRILVAHSWGGPVALALAAERPELVEGVVLIASPGDPRVSQPRWYHKVAKSKIVQFFIGKSMTRSNVEMLTLDDELVWLSDRLENITQPVVIMQGKKDWLVKPQNAFYLQRMLSNASVNLKYDMKANHFIPFRQADEVAQAVGWASSEITLAETDSCTANC